MIKKILKKDKLIRYVIFLFAFFPLIPNNLKGLPVILLFLAVIISDFKKEVNWKWLLINSSLFLVYLFSLVYTENLKEGLTKLETGLSILILPIIFYGFLAKFNFDQSLKIKFFKFFIVSTFIFSVISFVFIGTDNTTIYFSDWFTDKFRVIITEMPLIGQHPIYASIFLAISVVFYITLIKLKAFSTNFGNVYVLFLVINLILLFCLASKGVIIGLFIVCFLDAIKNFKKVKTVLVFLIMAVVVFSFNRRFQELFRADSYTIINENFSTSIRVGVYKCAFKIIEEEFLFGYGIGDSQRALNLCYANKSNVLLKNRFNSHNQYLDVIIKTGFIGFLFFIYFLYKNFQKAFRGRNNIVVLILMFYCVLFLTENILVRQSGVILFFFLISFLNHNIAKIEKYD